MSNDIILIVGAGPTGLTAAVELARQGIITDIVDKRDAASTWSRAVGILPSSLNILKPSGVATSLLQAGIHAHDVHIFWKGRKVMSALIDSGQPRTETLVALPQDETENILREAFEAYGGKVSYGLALTDLYQTEESVLATFEDGNQKSYEYVIGADGIDSLVRQSQNIAYDGIVLPDAWSIADVDADDWPHPESFCGFLNGGGKIAVVIPIGTNRYRVIANRTDALSNLPISMNITKIRREGNFHILIKQAETYHKGRVFLAGDSAHCHSPVGGRGMNVGIADAADLARRFAENDLDGYSVERHAAGKEVIKFTERGRKIVSSTNPLTRAVLWMVLAVVAKTPTLQRKMTEFLLHG